MRIKDNTNMPTCFPVFITELILNIYREKMLSDEDTLRRLVTFEQQKSLAILAHSQQILNRLNIEHQEMNKRSTISGEGLSGLSRLFSDYKNKQSKMNCANNTASRESPINGSDSDSESGWVILAINNAN